MTQTVVAKEQFDRSAKATKCPECNGYAEKAEVTESEKKEHGCWIDKTGTYTCCARAFICQFCGTRIVGKAEAPDMDTF